MMKEREKVPEKREGRCGAVDTTVITDVSVAVFREWRD